MQFWKQFFSETLYGAPLCFSKHFHQLTLKPVYINNPKVNNVAGKVIQFRFYKISIYITILLGVVLVRSAPTTFHILDVDDFTSINVTFVIKHFNSNLVKFWIGLHFWNVIHKKK
jgi:hypothetical protein